jgi:DNA polymerase-3 subunit epsilon/CBS domain-containing protein
MASSQNPARAPSSATPLASLNAIAFDTETTGLDTTRARIIQVGAVKICTGRIDETQTFQQLVNPGEPIPPASTAIHGIYDDDIDSAESFVAVKAEFDNWCDNSVMIGYASGFDLAMFKREHQLSGLEWYAPRTLDVRYLVNIVAPNLPDFSLDTIAAWLGVEIHDRHSALGDSISTAKIFLALIPRLRERGIRTLAEAEKACRQFTMTTAKEVSLGWHELHRPSSSDQSSLIALERIDSFPYRHRLRDLMHSPAILVKSGLSLRQVLNTLIENEISAVFVEPDADHPHTGIVTERDLLRCINQGGEEALETLAGDIAQYPLHSLSADAFVYRAIARMRRKHFRHLGVHDSQGRIVGALSARDLLRQRADDAIALGDDIDEAGNAEAMAKVWGQIAAVAQSLMSEEVDARDIAAVISRELCALTRQACKLAEAEMLEQGLGPAPCAYAMLVLGSGGRGESMLAMDQDNAIVYASGDPDSDIDKWFADLGKRVSDSLDTAGVPYCNGNIMASNADWRHSLEHWQETIKTWIKRQTPEDIMNCDIFFDAVCVHGDFELAEQTIDFAFELGSQSTSFLKLMSVNACKDRVPLGLFGRFKLEDGRMDLKMGGILPIFSCARILAIQHRIDKHSTPDRLRAARELQDKMDTIYENLDEAHRIIFNIILQQQLWDIEAGVPPSNFIAPASLSGSMLKQLKWALDRVPGVSNLLGDPLSSI